MLPVSQVIGETTILQWDPGIYESGGTAVVVHEERLKHTGAMFYCNRTASNVAVICFTMLLWHHKVKTTGLCGKKYPVQQAPVKARIALGKHLKLCRSNSCLMIMK